MLRRFLAAQPVCLDFYWARPGSVIWSFPRGTVPSFELRRQGLHHAAPDGRVPIYGSDSDPRSRFPLPG